MEINLPFSSQMTYPWEKQCFQLVENFVWHCGLWYERKGGSSLGLKQFNSILGRTLEAITWLLCAQNHCRYFCYCTLCTHSILSGKNSIKKPEPHCWNRFWRSLLHRLELFRCTSLSIWEVAELSVKESPKYYYIYIKLYLPHATLLCHLSCIVYIHIQSQEYQRTSKDSFSHIKVTTISLEKLHGSWTFKQENTPFLKSVNWSSVQLVEFLWATVWIRNWHWDLNHFRASRGELPGLLLYLYPTFK